MADSVDDLIRKRAALKKEIENKSREVAVAKANRERLESELTKQLEFLKETFEVTTFEQALEMRDEMQEDISRKLDELDKLLHEDHGN